MDKGARLWLAKAVRKNYWRVSRWYDLEDVIQEGYYAYYYVVKHYPKVTHPPHRMALFKLTFNSVICNLANDRTKRTDEVCESELSADENYSFLSSVCADPGIAECTSFVNAPQYVRDVLALFQSEAGLFAMRERYRTYVARDKHGRYSKLRRRETLNERLCRLTGYDPKQVNIVEGIKACLAGD